MVSLSCYTSLYLTTSLATSILLVCLPACLIALRQQSLTDNVFDLRGKVSRPRLDSAHCDIPHWQGRDPVAYAVPRGDGCKRARAKSFADASRLDLSPCVGSRQAGLVGGRARWLAANVSKPSASGREQPLTVCVEMLALMHMRIMTTKS